MANKRMFSKTVINSARFLKMPSSSRLLYYDLGMAADDDGVVEAFMVMRMTGATEDDLRVLHSKGFIKILNEDLVAYITDWKQNNTIRADRKIDSVYQELLLEVCPDVVLMQSKQRSDRINYIPDGTDMGQSQDSPWTDMGQHSIDKNSIDIDNNSIIYNSNNNSIYSNNSNTVYKEFNTVILSKYPGNKTKSVRDKKVPKLLEKYSPEELERCIDRYAKDCIGREKKYILNESTFWNGRYMDYLDCNYTDNLSGKEALTETKRSKLSEF